MSSNAHSIRFFRQVITSNKIPPPKVDESFNYQMTFDPATQERIRKTTRAICRRKRSTLTLNCIVHVIHCPYDYPPLNQQRQLGGTRSEENFVRSNSTNASTVNDLLEQDLKIAEMVKAFEHKQKEQAKEKRRLRRVLSEFTKYYRSSKSKAEQEKDDDDDQHNDQRQQKHEINKWSSFATPPALVSVSRRTKQSTTSFARPHHVHFKNNNDNDDDDDDDGDIVSTTTTIQISKEQQEEKDLLEFLSKTEDQQRVILRCLRRNTERRFAGHDGAPIDFLSTSNEYFDGSDDDDDGHENAGGDDDDVFGASVLDDEKSLLTKRSHKKSLDRGILLDGRFSSLKRTATGSFLPGMRKQQRQQQQQRQRKQESPKNLLATPKRSTSVCSLLRPAQLQQLVHEHREKEQERRLKRKLKKQERKTRRRSATFPATMTQRSINKGITDDEGAIPDFSSSDSSSSMSISPTSSSSSRSSSSLSSSASSCSSDDDDDAGGGRNRPNKNRTRQKQRDHSDDDDEDDEETHQLISAGIAGSPVAATRFIKSTAGEPKLTMLCTIPIASTPDEAVRAIEADLKKYHKRKLSHPCEYYALHPALEAFGALDRSRRPLSGNCAALIEGLGSFPFPPLALIPNGFAVTRCAVETRLEPQKRTVLYRQWLVEAQHLNGISKLLRETANVAGLTADLENGERIMLKRAQIRGRTEIGARALMREESDERSTMWHDASLIHEQFVEYRELIQAFYQDCIFDFRRANSFLEATRVVMSRAREEIIQIVQSRHRWEELQEARERYWIEFNYKLRCAYTESRLASEVAVGQRLRRPDDFGPGGHVSQEKLRSTKELYQQRQRIQHQGNTNNCSLLVRCQRRQSEGDDENDDEDDHFEERTTTATSLFQRSSSAPRKTTIAASSPCSIFSSSPPSSLTKSRTADANVVTSPLVNETVVTGDAFCSTQLGFSYKNSSCDRHNPKVVHRTEL